MLSPSAAPRWNNTTNCFLPVVAGEAATARCKNAGIALIPTIAIPPCFRKYRRENFNGRRPSQHRSLIVDSLGVGRLAAAFRSHHVSSHKRATTLPHRELPALNLPPPPH